jgi:hypothetical protein
MPELAFGSMPVPATPIGELTRSHLDIRCSRCRRHVPLQLQDLIVRYGLKLRISEVLGRLRCSGPCDGEICRGRPAQVVMIEVDHCRKVREIIIAGPR